MKYSKPILVFDFGNTITNSADMIKNTWRFALQGTGIDIEDFEQMYSSHAFTNEGAFSTIEKVEWTLNQMPPTKTDPKQLLDTFQHKYELVCRDNIEHDPFGSWSALSQLSQHYHLGILSDNSEFTRQKWIRLWQEYDTSFFDFFITSELVGEWKPHRKMFEAVLEYTDVLSDCYYFGNSLIKDAPAADYGYHFVHVYGHDRDTPDNEYEAIEYINKENLQKIGLL